MPLDPQIAILLDFINSAGKPMHESTPAEAREAFRVMSVDMVKPDDVVQVGSVEDLTVAGRPARLYRPEGEGEKPTLVFFHGGGYVVGDLDTHDQSCRRICRGADTTVLSIDYRLAPEHPFPAGAGGRDRGHPLGAPSTCRAPDARGRRRQRRRQPGGGRTPTIARGRAGPGADLPGRGRSSATTPRARRTPRATSSTSATMEWFLRPLRRR